MLDRCIGIVFDLIELSRVVSLAVVVVLRVFLISFVLVFFISVIEPLIVINGSIDWLTFFELFKSSFSFFLYIVNETDSDFISFSFETLDTFGTLSLDSFLLSAKKNLRNY